MNLELFVQSRLVSDLGLTLFHSLWQITLIFLVLMIGLRLLTRATAHVRYLVSLMALLLSLAVPAVTFIQISNGTEMRTARGDAPIDATGIRASAEHGVTGDLAGASALERVAASRKVIGDGYLSGVYDSLPDLYPIAVMIWGFGVVFFSLRLLGGFTRLRDYRRNAVGAVDPKWQDICSSMCERLHIERAVEIVRSTVVETPIAIGTLRPLIIVPASLFLQIHPRELETIIAHELIHIRRYDPLVNLFQCAIETLLFYHPGVWWISARIRREREFAADSAVVEIFPNSHVTYAKALANLEEIRQRTNQQMPRYATAANGGNLMNRIQKILKTKTEADSASSAWTAGLALLMASAFLLTTFSFSSSELVNAQSRSGNRKLAIGFVSIPPLDRTANAPKDGDATARLLIQKLKEYKVPATGFLMGGMISDGEKLYPVRANIARLWVDAGFEVGLGGFKHLKLYNTSADEYIANIEKNEAVAKRLLGDMALPPRYFSYPFLNTGKTAEDKAKVEGWLASRGYTPVKYTFDNQEWMYSFAYDMARNDNDVNTMKEIRAMYLAYMEKMFDHYEAYSIEHFGRDIPQTMVLTPSRLITDTADEFFGMATKRGYSFITLNEAQSDPAYKTPENFLGPGGISWFERWSMAKGRKLRQEPDVDQAIMHTWNDRKNAAWK